MPSRHAAENGGRRRCVSGRDALGRQSLAAPPRDLAAVRGAGLVPVGGDSGGCCQLMAGRSVDTCEQRPSRRFSGIGRGDSLRRSDRRDEIARQSETSSAAGWLLWSVTAARCAGSAGLGSRRTCAPQPKAAKPTRRWCSAAPQLMSRSRPAGSVSTSWRRRSAYKCRARPPTRHNHGWELCTDGARAASDTAASSAC